MSSLSRKAVYKYQAKNKDLYEIVEKIKLWPSRSGLLHGIKNVTLKGNQIFLETHCGVKIEVNNSKNGRGIRQLRNRTCPSICKKCKIPDWKIKKYTE